MPEWYYAVRNGRERGVYNNWGDCERQVKGYDGNRHKKFRTREEAEAFVADDGSTGGRDRVPARREEVRQYSHPPPPSQEPARFHSAGTGQYYRRDETDNRKRHREPDPPRERSPTPPPRSASRTSRWPGAASTHALDGHLRTVADVVYTDGACPSNGKGAAAVGGYGVFYGEGDADNVARPLSATESQTNNRAELRAVIHAIEHAPKRDSRFGGAVRPIKIHTDSSYVTNAVGGWLEQWKRDGRWKTASGEPVKNVDLWQRMDGLLAERRNSFRTYLSSLPEARSLSSSELDSAAQRWAVELVKVSGHSGVPGNEAADRLAVLGASMQSRR